MRINSIIKVLGLLMLLFAVTLVPPILVAFLYTDSSPMPFILSFSIIAITGLSLWFPFQHSPVELRVRDGFLLVFLFWTVFGIVGSLPLTLTNEPNLTLTNAVFESISGLTTTGATVITGLDELPHSILYYRQQLQWIGGLGIVILAVAILPFLGIGGMQLYRAETPGPMKEDKMTPRIRETAKVLWYIYFGLTTLCAFCYWLAGMSVFDAICHAYATIAIGGFSTHDLSLGYFNSVVIEMVAVIFMVLAGINFSLHYLSISGRSFKPYWRNSESRAYIYILIVVAVTVVLGLMTIHGFANTPYALHHGIFQAVSIATTTGFTTTQYALWPSFLPVLLIFASFMGGCIGSTAGGLKTLRIILLFKQGSRELKRLIHPQGFFNIKIGGKPIPDRVIEGVWGFFATYVMVFAVIMLLMMATGLDQITAFSAVAACLNNLGPGLGDVAAHYGEIPDVSKWILCVAMLLGRLEIFTLLILFTPIYWRK